ncbi:hypothetical protein BGZ96_003018 [Linnemannia gamsii]|uniref:BTB domain-containing protein n=1 Tax=Linnemannia gamsii TaxID=64522 RepID=A0ABQ7K857_9FUNG|nr:hypothetical protein BGZ96_003018 [Linnemannia gamsii]
MNERDIERNKPTVLEMTLTIGHQDEDDEEEDENAKEYYAAMIHTIHLFEINFDSDRLYMSKAIDGYDLIHHGVSFLVDTKDIVKTELCTLGILLSSDPLELLVPPDVIVQSATDHPFGRSTLIHFLLDTSSADIAYTPLLASMASSSSSTTTLPRLTHSVHYNPRPQPDMIYAHSAILHQFPSFHRMICNFSRQNDNPKIHRLIDIDPQSMRLLINFLYLTQIEGPGYTGIIDWRPIFQLAHRFQITRLAELSLSELCKGMMIRKETVVETLFGWAYQHPDYEDRLIGFLVEFSSDVFSPTAEERLEPYRRHREFERVCRKVAALKLARRRSFSIK